MQLWSEPRKPSRQVRRSALVAKPWPAAQRAAAAHLHNSSSRAWGSSSSGAVGRRRQAGT